MTRDGDRLMSDVQDGSTSARPFAVRASSHARASATTNPASMRDGGDATRHRATTRSASSETRNLSRASSRASAHPGRLSMSAPSGSSPVSSQWTDLPIPSASSSSTSERTFPPASRRRRITPSCVSCHPIASESFRIDSSRSSATARTRSATGLVSLFVLGALPTRALCPKPLGCSCSCWTTYVLSGNVRSRLCLFSTLTPLGAA